MLRLGDPGTGPLGSNTAGTALLTPAELVGVLGGMPVEELSTADAGDDDRSSTADIDDTAGISVLGVDVSDGA